VSADEDLQVQMLSNMRFVPLPEVVILSCTIHCECHSIRPALKLVIRIGAGYLPGLQTDGPPTIQPSTPPPTQTEPRNKRCTISDQTGSQEQLARERVSENDENQCCSSSAIACILDYKANHQAFSKCV